MNRRSLRCKAVACLLGWLAWCPLMGAQASPFPGQDVPAIYQRLLAQINQIPIIDMHAHPGYYDDTDVDAMAVSEAATSPLRLRPSSPELLAADKALYGYPFDDYSPEHLRWLQDKVDGMQKQYGKEYLSHVLDMVGIQVGAANRVAMDYLEHNPRFRFVVFVDPFMFPFNNHDLAINPDRAVYFPIQEKALHRYLGQVGPSQLPPDFAGYEAAIRRVLEQDKQQQGAVAIKFEAPYFRSLVNITDPPRRQAEAIYNKYHAGGTPSADEYRLFQDYIFRYLIAQAAPLDLEVHIHSAVGSGDYYRLMEGNAMDLENILRDPRYGKTVFVLIHGGYPFDRQSIWLATLRNVYLDSSEFVTEVYPAEFARVLKYWFELFPEKVVFGSDAFPYSRQIAAPEIYWLAVQTARTSAAAALAEMVSEGEISESKALEIARDYFHDTSARLFGIAPLAGTH